MYFVIEVQSGKEIEMEKEITSYPHGGIFDFVFAPRKKRLKKYQGEWHEVSDVIFNGYLFVKTDKPDKVKSLLFNIEGYTRMLCSYEKNHINYLPLSEDEEAMINAFFSRDKELEISIVDVKLGKIERVVSGPLKEYENKIVGVDLHKRLAKISTTIAGMDKIMYFGIDFNKISGTQDILETVDII